MTMGLHSTGTEENNTHTWPHIMHILRSEVICASNLTEH